MLEIRNPNIETRNKLEFRKGDKFETKVPLGFDIFPFRASDFLRISRFGLRILTTHDLRFNPGFPRWFATRTFVLTLLAVTFTLITLSAQPAKNIILFIGDGREVEKLLEFSKKRGENPVHRHRLSDLTHATPSAHGTDVDPDLT
jgi:hypothetical protein